MGSIIPGSHHEVPCVAISCLQCYGGIPYTVQASEEGTPASAVRLAATLPYTGYGHNLPYGYAGYGQFPGYTHPGYAHPGYAHPGYAYPGLGYAAAAAPAKDE